MKQLNWLPVSERVKYKNLLIIHKSIVINNPSYINALFKINEIQNILTRQTNGNNIKIAKPISEFHRRSISIYGPQIYNSIPLHIRQSKNFSDKLKMYLIQEYYKDQ